jgi:hypothetical protein
MVRSIAVLLVGGLLSACAVPLWAQEAILGQMYGNGVHAYFSGEYVRAHQLLTAAIDAGSRDPRCYYFRGLSYLRLGRPQEAEADFQQGAKLETADLNRTYSVAKSLERIQGPPRAEVERYRIQARMAALDRSEKDRQRRYEGDNLLGRQALEQQAGAAPTKASSTEPIAAPQATPPAAQPENPFGVPEKNGPEPAPKPTGPPVNQEPAAKPAPEPAAKPETKPPTEDSDPFGPGKPGPESAKPATEAAPGPGKATSPEKKHGFGGALKQAIGKALGGDENKTSPAATEKPAGEKPPAEPASKAPTPLEKPAKPESDEGPAAKPATKPPADDPFADSPPADEKPAKKPPAKEPAAKKPGVKE